MHTLYRRIYRLLLRLHPPTFRNEFACEMALDFEDALHTYGFGHLLLDAASSLARQWSVHVISDAPNPVSARRPSLLAGDYVIVHDRAITALELGRGILASTVMFALCISALSISPGHAFDIPIVSASSSEPAMDRRPQAGTRMPVDESSNSRFKVSQSAVAASAQIGTPATTLPSNGSAATSTLGCTTLAGSAPTQLKPELLLFHPSGPLPSYEVATIKLLDPNTASDMVRLGPGVSLSPLSIRRYVMNAYGAIYPPQVVGGPDWLNKDAYVIKGKVPDDLQSAFQKMSREDHNNQVRMMEQCLLADRFHLKAHYETQILPVYELVPAKKGLKITEVLAPPEHKPGEPPPRPLPGDTLAPGSMMSKPGNTGIRVLNGRAIKMQLLARVIGSDVGNRPIVDHTGFTGDFDVNDLTWTPLGDAASQGDAPSLAGALEEKLGLRLVAARDPIEVLVIDSIDRPTPN